MIKKIGKDAARRRREREAEEEIPTIPGRPLIPIPEKCAGDEKEGVSGGQGEREPE